MFQEAIASLRMSLRERVTSPLLGAFIGAWLVWNYQFILIVFSGMHTITKIEYITGTLYADWQTAILFHFLGPLFAAGLFILLYPFPAKWAFHYTGLRRQKLLELKYKLEGQEPISPEKALTLREEIAKLNTRYIEEMQKQVEKNDELEKIVSERTSEITDLRSKMDNLKAKAPREITESDFRLLEKVIAKTILSHSFRLIFDPTKGIKASKIMTFGPDGKIIEGQNKNESRWQIVDGKLEFIQSDGHIHSRFKFDPESKLFSHTNDDELPSIKGQFLIPDASGTQ